MTSSGDQGTRAIMAFDIRLWRAVQSQCLRGVNVRPGCCLPVDQSMQQVRHMGLGGDTFRPSHSRSDQQGLFIVMQNQREGIDHIPVAACSPQHEVFQLPEGLWEFQKRAHRCEMHRTSD